MKYYYILLIVGSSFLLSGCSNNLNSLNASVKSNKKAQFINVEKHPEALQYIKNPSEKVQLAAVKKNPYAIRYIKNPSEKVQLAAVEKNPYAIRYIKNPSEKVQLAAVEKNIEALQFIKDPSEKVQLAAVEKNPDALQYIKDPSEKVQLAAVEKYPGALQYIKNPSKKIQIAAHREVTIEIPRLNFKLSNDAITIASNNGKLTITNKTNKFMKVLSLSEYKGKDIFTISNITIPPMAIKTIYLNDRSLIKVNSLNDKVLFGYAAEYKVGNGKVNTVFKTREYSVKDFIH